MRKSSNNFMTENVFFNLAHLLPYIAWFYLNHLTISFLLNYQSLSLLCRLVENHQSINVIMLRHHFSMKSHRGMKKFEHCVWHQKSHRFSVIPFESNFHPHQNSIHGFMISLLFIDKFSPTTVDTASILINVFKAFKPSIFLLLLHWYFFITLMVNVIGITLLVTLLQMKWKLLK